MSRGAASCVCVVRRGVLAPIPAVVWPSRPPLPTLPGFLGCPLFRSCHSPMTLILPLSVQDGWRLHTPAFFFHSVPPSVPSLSSPPGSLTLRIGP